MKSVSALCLLDLCLMASTALSAQRIPAATELPGDPFFIKHTWVIGGEGNWDYMVLDPARLQLFVAHGPIVQVVDVEAGTVAAKISGMRDAHGIALDDTGDFGYIRDGPAASVKVFDRHTFEVVASLPTGPNPRAIVYEPLTKLLFAISAEPGPTRPSPAQPGAPRPGGPAGVAPQRSAAPRSGLDSETLSMITVIDTETRATLAYILLSVKLGFAQTDGSGAVFINIVDRNQIARLDAPAVATLLQGHGDAGASLPKNEPVRLDWRASSHSPQSIRGQVRFFSLAPECVEPRALAVDSRHLRLFAACANMKMAVLNSVTGEPVATLPIGPGADAIGYDPDRGLIYTANGDAMGSLTVIRQHVTDTYSVIQNLPTQQRTRTLAVNPATGEVYLVTDLRGVDLTRKGGIGALKLAPVSGSFQVLVVAN
jgi:DNA-binding beta-propeller fold protein YncE